MAQEQMDVTSCPIIKLIEILLAGKSSVPSAVSAIITHTYKKQKVADYTELPALACKYYKHVQVQRLLQLINFL